MGASSSSGHFKGTKRLMPNHSVFYVFTRGPDEQSGPLLTGAEAKEMDLPSKQWQRLLCSAKVVKNIAVTKELRVYNKDVYGQKAKNADDDYSNIQSTSTYQDYSQFDIGTENVPGNQTTQRGFGACFFRAEMISPYVLLPVLQSFGRSVATSPPTIVVDPFMGVGTTGLVAQSLACEFVGQDISPKSGQAYHVLLAKADKSKTKEWAAGAKLLVHPDDLDDDGEDDDEEMTVEGNDDEDFEPTQVLVPDEEVEDVDDEGEEEDVSVGGDEQVCLFLRTFNICFLSFLS